MLVNPAVQEMLGTLPPAEQDELLVLAGQAGAAAAGQPAAEGPAP